MLVISQKKRIVFRMNLNFERIFHIILSILSTYLILCILYDAFKLPKNEFEYKILGGWLRYLGVPEYQIRSIVDSYFF